MCVCVCVSVASLSQGNSRVSASCCKTSVCLASTRLVQEGNMTRDVNSNQNRVNPRGCMAEIATTTLTWTYVGGGKE